MRVHVKYLILSLLAVALISIYAIKHVDESRVESESTPLSIDEASMEVVSAVLYFRTSIPKKIPNDWILLSSGETIEIERSKLSPQPEFVTTHPDFKTTKKLATKDNEFQIFFSRRQNIACLKKQCAKIFTICPSNNELQRGKLCDSLSFKSKEN